MLTPAATKLN